MNEVEFYLEDLKSKFNKIDFNNYSLSYSGGKDSHFLYWFIKQYLKDDKIKIVGVNTYMEHPQIRKRMYDNCDVVLKPELNPMEIKKKYGSPCFSKLQDEYISRYQKGNRTKNTMDVVLGNNVMINLNNTARNKLLSGNLHKISNKCCDYLKKKPMKKYLKDNNKKNILGVRASESIIRANAYKSCFDKQGNFSPLWDLTSELLNNIYKQYGIEIPPIYKTLTRTGCMGCPYGSNILKELKTLTISQKKFVTNYHKESYQTKGIPYDTEQLDIYDMESED